MLNSQVSGLDPDEKKEYNNRTEGAFNGELTNPATQIRNYC